MSERDQPYRYHTFQPLAGTPGRIVREWRGVLGSTPAYECTLRCEHLRALMFVDGLVTVREKPPTWGDGTDKECTHQWWCWQRKRFSSTPGRLLFRGQYNLGISRIQQAARLKPLVRDYRVHQVQQELDIKAAECTDKLAQRLQLAIAEFLLPPADNTTDFEERISMLYRLWLNQLEDIIEHPVPDLIESVDGIIIDPDPAHPNKPTPRYVRFSIDNKPKGFSLLELLTAIVIIGILAAISIPVYLRAVDRSRESYARLYTSALLKEQMLGFTQTLRFSPLNNLPSYQLLRGSDGYVWQQFQEGNRLRIIAKPTHDRLKDYCGFIEVLDPNNPDPERSLRMYGPVEGQGQCN